jgi:hypothetical protein
MRRRPSAVAALTALAVLAAACSNGHPSSGSSPGATTAGSMVGADVLRQYVGDLDRGDYTAAVQLRCLKGQVPSSLLGQFGTEVARVRTAAGGSLTLKDITPVSPVTLASLDGSTPVSQLRYTFDTSSGTSTAVEVAVIVEGGTPKLCGTLQVPAVAAQGSLAERTLVSASGTITTLATALPATVLPGYAEADDRAVTDLSAIPGATEGWTRVWNTSDHHGLRVSLFRTASAADANTLAHRLLAVPGLDSAEMVDQLDHQFLGVSVVGSAWTWVQPASYGPRVDRAVQVVGTVVVSVELGGLDTKDGHALLQQVASALTWK